MWYIYIYIYIHIYNEMLLAIGEANGNPFQYVAWTEEPGGLQSMGSQESDMTKQLNHPLFIHENKQH